MTTPAIIIGDTLENLQPDGPEYFSRETNFVMTATGPIEGTRIEERMQVMAANLAITLPPYFQPHEAPYGDCAFIGFREGRDRSGLLSKVTLIWKSDPFTAGTIRIGLGETVWELDQTLMQVPIERDDYFASLTHQEFADVISCLEQGQFSGTANGEDLGFNADGNLVYVLPTTAKMVADVMSDLQTELFLEKLKGRDYIMRPGTTFRKMTTGQIPNFPAAMVNAGRLQYPGNGLPGTRDNWLVNTPRLERRLSDGQTFNMVTNEWLYNPAKWDTAPYRFYQHV